MYVFQTSVTMKPKLSLNLDFSSPSLLSTGLTHVPPYLAQHLQVNRSVHTGQDKRIRVMLMYTHTQTHSHLLETGMASGLELIVRDVDFFPI